MRPVLIGWIVCGLLIAPFGAPGSGPAVASAQAGQPGVAGHESGRVVPRLTGQPGVTGHESDRVVPRLTGQPEEIIRLVNAFRAANGLPALAENASLMAAAQGHADWQAATHNHYHVGQDGSLPQDRANAAGYHGWVSEDVASGTSRSVSPEWAVNTGWANSPPHRAAMLAWAADVGAGVAQDADQTYFVLEVGMPSIQAPPTAYPRAVPESIPDGARVHSVQEGETPWSIAAFYGVPLAALLAVNHLNTDEILQPGDELIVPPADFPVTGTPAAMSTPEAVAAQPPGSVLPPVLLIGTALAASILALGISVAARRRRNAVGGHKHPTVRSILL